jgi:hypothetical protein
MSGNDAESSVVGNALAATPTIVTNSTQRCERAPVARSDRRRV